MIFEWVDADRGCIMLKDIETGQLVPKVRRHRRGLQADERITISQTILDYVVDRNEGVLTSNARDDDRWDAAKSILRMGVREAICVPMQGRYDVVGVIYIDTSLTPAADPAAGLGQQVHAGTPEAHDRDRPSGGAGDRRYVLLQSDGAGRAAGGRRANDRLAFAPHQEHFARRARRQLSHRNGHQGPCEIDHRRRDRRRCGRKSRLASCGRAGASSKRTRSGSPRW